MSSSFTPAPPQSRSGPAARPLFDGPRWFRARIRAWGPFLALLAPGVAGVIAYAALRWSDSAWSGSVGLVGAMFAAPGLLIVGAPFGERSLYPLAIAASGLMWLLIGWWAARRATRNPMATWSSFWQHYTWLLLGIWAGVVGALGVAYVSLGQTVF